MMRFAPPLHPDDELALRAMRQRLSKPCWRVVEIAKQAGMPYARAWRAKNRLFKLGYVMTDGLGNVYPRWERVIWPHRAQVSELLGVEPEVFVPPGRWQRFVERWGPYVGVSWEGKSCGGSSSACSTR